MQIITLLLLSKLRKTFITFQHKSVKKWQVYFLVFYRFEKMPAEDRGEDFLRSSHFPPFFLK